MNGRRNLPLTVCDTQPDALTRVCLLGATVVPWYAVASGVFGLYFYVLVLVPQVGRVLSGTSEEVATDALFAVTLFAALPLGLLLLLAVPAGLLLAAFGRPPGGLAGGTVRAGCVASMAFSALYVAFIIVAYVTGLTQDGAAEVWWSGLIHIAVMLCGLGATWRAWRWLRLAAVVIDDRAGMDVLQNHGADVGQCRGG